MTYPYVNFHENLILQFDSSVLVFLLTWVCPFFMYGHKSFEKRGFPIDLELLTKN